MSVIVPGIGNRFSEFRNKLNISQQDVADVVELSRPYITQVENSKANPSFKLLYQLRMKYNLSIDWLLSGQGEMIVSENSITDEMTEEHYELIKRLLQLESRKQSKLIGGFLEIINVE